MKKWFVAAAALVIIGIPAAYAATPSKEQPKSATTAQAQSADNAAKTCKAELKSMGAEAFAKKYGTNHNLRNAFGKCVSGKSKDDKDEKDEDGDDWAAASRRGFIRCGEWAKLIVRGFRDGRFIPVRCGDRWRFGRFGHFKVRRNLLRMLLGREIRRVLCPLRTYVRLFRSRFVWGSFS